LRSKYATEGRRKSGKVVRKPYLIDAVVLRGS